MSDRRSTTRPWKLSCAVRCVPCRPAKPRPQAFHARKARNFQAISTRHHERLELAAAALFLFASPAGSGALARRFISSRSQASACAMMVDRSSKRGCLQLLCHIDDDGFDRVMVLRACVMSQGVLFPD